MYNNILTTIDSVKEVVRNAYGEQDWLVIVLKNNGWADNTIPLKPAIRSTVATIEINELVIIARRETLELANRVEKIKITIDFRVPGHDGWYHTIEILKYPTEEDIRATLLRLREYTKYNIVVPIAQKL